MDLGQIYDIQTVEVMKRALRQDENAIDVGCHLGSILLEFLKAAPKGHHHAFEPLPDLFAHLQKDFGGNAHVSLHELALSDASGVATFQHVISNPAYSRLRQRRYDRENE